MQEALQGALRRPDHKAVRVTDAFWGGQLNKIHTVTVWDVINKFEHDQEKGILQNFEWVMQGKTGEHVGPPWYDGLICEVIRGVSDIIAVTGDQKLIDKVDAYTQAIAGAQDMDPDGYLNTYVTLMRPDKRWGQNGGSLIWQHETYDMGALIEAGVHYYRATGKTALLICAVKAANCMCGVIGPEPRKNIVPAHSLAEEAVLKLYRLLSDEPALAETLRQTGLKVCPQDYLDLARFWMDHRGVHHNRASMPHYMGEYAQDHCRIEEQSEAVGHAVRAALLYTGLAALGIETGDRKYLDASMRLWKNVTLTKLHISGGIGAIHNEERFGYQYDLPNDAYLETCAGVAMAFWSGEMHRAYHSAEYIDVLECALYNNVLPCLSADGTHYFYENPLISDGSVERWSWHGCPCCPPMFLKLMGCLQDYIYSYGDNALYVNLHMGSALQGEMGGRPFTLEQKDCALPWKGSNRIVFSASAPLAFALHIRKPAYSGACTLLLNGEPVQPPMKEGYWVLDRRWDNGDEIALTMELPVIKVEAHPYVDADAGRVALMRGPLLYCLEEIDNAGQVDPLLDNSPLAVEEMDLFGPAMAITGRSAQGEALRAVPYYLWCNRGPGKMAVWLRQDAQPGENALGAQAAAGFAAHAPQNNQTASLDGWEGRLYRAYRPKA